MIAKRNTAIILSVILAFIVTLDMSPNTRRMGDRLQYMLPFVASVCALDAGELGRTLGRYTLGYLSAQAFRNGLPQTGINQRPDGGGNGFPSTHTYAAAFGASYIARTCAQRIPYIGTIAIVAAGFTASSRVEHDKHTVWQVLFGAIFALVFDRAFLKRASRNPEKKTLQRSWNWVRSRIGIKRS